MQQFLSKTQRCKVFCLTILANNHQQSYIVLNEAKWDKIRKEISKENNEILNEKRS